MHVVAVPPDRDDHPVQSFRTFTTDLQRLADWLVACRVTTVALESTGVFWIPIYEILEARGIVVQLVNARHVRNLPGRKSDVSDAPRKLTVFTASGVKPGRLNIEVPGAPDKSGLCWSIAAAKGSVRAVDPGVEGALETSHTVTASSTEGVVIAGFNVVAIKTDAQGSIDLADLKSKAQQHRDKLACLMITYPSTRGVFAVSIRRFASSSRAINCESW